MTTVLITGAAGALGDLLTAQLSPVYRLVLSDIKPIPNPRGCPTIIGDIADPEVASRATRGIDVVVHLAASARAWATWDDVLQPNIIGVRQVFDAAATAGCRRVVFASSVHAVMGYPAHQQIHEAQAVRPPDLYGATKAWGEALGYYYAERHALSVLCLRLGWVFDPLREELNPQHPEFDIILTYADMVRLVVASIEAPPALRFGIYHGVSNNRWSRLDTRAAREDLRYAPRDDVYAMAERAARPSAVGAAS